MVTAVETGIEKRGKRLFGPLIVDIINLLPLTIIGTEHHLEGCRGLSVDKIHGTPVDVLVIQVEEKKRRISEIEAQSGIFAQAYGGRNEPFVLRKVNLLTVLIGGIGIIDNGKLRPLDSTGNGLLGTFGVHMPRKLAVCHRCLFGICTLLAPTVRQPGGSLSVPRFKIFIEQRGLFLFGEATYGSLTTKHRTGVAAEKFHALLYTAQTDIKDFSIEIGGKVRTSQREHACAGNLRNQAERFRLWNSRLRHHFGRGLRKRNKGRTCKRQD